MHDISILIHIKLKVLDSELVDRCPHRSEIQSIVLAETDSKMLINVFC